MGLGAGCGEERTRGGMSKQVVALSNGVRGKLVSQLDTGTGGHYERRREGGREEGEEKGRLR